MNMKSPRILTLCALVAAVIAGPPYCDPSQPCWPSAGDVSALANSLSPLAPRILKWNGLPFPRVCAVPIFSPDDQPLYGLGVEGLRPVYTREDLEVCDFDPEVPPSDYCRAAVRNGPQEGFTPGFVVWPLTQEHVKIAVRFAKRHNLCIMVAGTGHDFLNRHSCKDGLFIRTSLMKSIEWDLNDSKRFGHPDGNVKFGPGIVFSEAHASAAEHNRVVASGWATTVGIVGWSIGGGHGPLSPSKGLGVDNILSIDIVIATGEAITASATRNSDLFWALRGGGGSTWGVITAITVRAHRIPPGGFTVISASFTDGMCQAGLEHLDRFTAGYTAWALALDKNFGGFAFFSSDASSAEEHCGATWTANLVYVYQGAPSHPVFTATLERAGLLFGEPSTSSLSQFANFYEFMVTKDLEPIIPVDVYHPSESYVGGVPSVMVSRDTLRSGRLFRVVKTRLLECKAGLRCGREELYHDITGHVGSPQNKFVSISTGFRTAVIHYVSTVAPGRPQSLLLALGSSSYFSESAYELSGYESRYWGSNFARLQRVKSAYDPSQVFGCRHCVEPAAPVLAN